MSWARERPYSPGGDGALCVVTCLIPTDLTSWNNDLITSCGKYQPSKATPSFTLPLPKGAAAASFFRVSSAKGAMRPGFNANGDQDSTRTVKQYPYTDRMPAATVARMAVSAMTVKSVHTIYQGGIQTDDGLPHSSNVNDPRRWSCHY